MRSKKSTLAGGWLPLVISLISFALACVAFLRSSRPLSLDAPVGESQGVAGEKGSSGLCTAPASSASVAQVEAALMEKPEMLVKAMEAYTNKQKIEKEVHQKQALSENEALLFNNAADPIEGNPEGDTALVEFFDYRCGYCRRAYGTLQQLIQNDPKLKVVYKEFPLFSGEPLMAKAALAAHRQGKYAALHKAFMNSSGNLTLEDIKTMAEKVGLDVSQLEKDMKDPSVEAELAQNRELGAKLGVEGTPFFILTGGIMQPGLGSVEDFKALIEKARGNS